MGRLFLIDLEGNFYSCKHCRTHLALLDHIISRDIMMTAEFQTIVYAFNECLESFESVLTHLLPVSQSFHCRHGTAYLFDNVVNVTAGEKEERMMMTGMHTVVDIFCVGCGSIVGWKYEAAYEKTQRYKEGKYILERFKVLGPNGSGYFATEEAQINGSDDEDA